MSLKRILRRRNNPDRISALAPRPGLQILTAGHFLIMPKRNYRRRFAAWVNGFGNLGLPWPFWVTFLGIWVLALLAFLQAEYGPLWVYDTLLLLADRRAGDCSLAQRLAHRYLRALEALQILISTSVHRDVVAGRYRGPDSHQDAIALGDE